MEVKLLQGAVQKSPLRDDGRTGAPSARDALVLSESTGVVDWRRLLLHKADELVRGERAGGGS
jgi:hypothetical protein